MDPHRAVHHRLRSKRQGLSGVLGGLVPNGPTTSAAKAATTSAQNPGNPFDPSGIVGAFSTLLGDMTSVMPSSGHSSSTGSTSTPTSSIHTTASTSTTSSTPTTSTTSITPAPTPTSTPSVSNTVYASSDGTSVVYITSTLPDTSATAAPGTSFLQNPSAEGGVFTLVGIVALIIVFVVITWTLRKRRRDRLERDLAAAVTFDPGATDRYEHHENSIEKRRLSGSTSGHGHGFGFGYGHGVQPAYAPRQEYHGPMGYGQYPAAAYHTHSPNSAPYRPPSPTVSQQAGGANLTRKFSDRKPVPPLLPNPAYDPSNSHVSIPPQFYQQ